jgi:hypothetical protein
MPNFHDQCLAMVNRFSGMSAEEFSYEEYEAIREQFVTMVNGNLTKSDKTFLLSFKNAEPDWSIYEFERFSSIQGKLRKLSILRQNNL